MKLFLFLAAALPAALWGLTQDPEDAEDQARAALTAALAQAGVHMDFEAQALAFDAEVVVKDELLEYLLVGPRGAAHEALFKTETTPSLINAGLMALGVEPGTNATWQEVDPQPTAEERRAGARPWRIVPPAGDGLYLHVAWREGEETFFFRIEDLIANLSTGRAMKRHRWVFLGGAFLSDPERGEVFAADVEGNLINISFFPEGHTLVTPALPACVDQSIWVANSWLVPPRDASVRMILSRAPLVAVPPSWAGDLPIVSDPTGSDRGDG